MRIQLSLEEGQADRQTSGNSFIYSGNFRHYRAYVTTATHSLVRVYKCWAKVIWG
jgi:hypothetical protein